MCVCIWVKLKAHKDIVPYMEAAYTANKFTHHHYFLMFALSHWLLRSSFRTYQMMHWLTQDEEHQPASQKDRQGMWVVMGYGVQLIIIIDQQ